MPDRYQSWILGGTLKALGVVRKWRPDAILSTYPLASAHRIGHLLHKVTGLPWIADFRDPMLQGAYPSKPALRKSFASIESAIFRHAARVTVTTEGTADLYRGRFPDYPRDHIKVIPNGFDEEMLSRLSTVSAPQAAGPHKLRFVHSGLLYPHERNPVPFFDAISELHKEGRLDESAIEIVLRGSGNDHQYQQQLDGRGIGGLVKLLPPIPYKDALAEICSADACLIFQGATCNFQIPAKIYEYLYVSRPILALTDAAGDTAALLRSVGMDNIVPMDNKDAIKKGFSEFVELLKAGKAPVAPADQVSRFSRKSASGMLARMLDAVISGQAAAAARRSSS